MAELELILQHGWALDASIWSAWPDLVCQLQPSINIGVAERGYFSSPSSQPTFTQSTNRKILVVHSLGLHLASREHFEKAHLLVIIGGFANFHDGTEKQSRLSQVAVRRMLQKLDRQPVQVVQDFYTNCGFSGEYGSEKTAQLENLQLLKNDLELLDRGTIDPEWLSLPKQVLILHGQQDAIAHPDHALRLKQFCKNSTVEICEQGTHALPCAQPRWCLEQMQRSLMVAR